MYYLNLLYNFIMYCFYLLFKFFVISTIIFIIFRIYKFIFPKFELFKHYFHLNYSIPKFCCKYKFEIPFYKFKFSKKKLIQFTIQALFLHYNTNFLIKVKPPVNIASTANVMPKYITICPVCIVTSTGASSISSSPCLLLSGVESISGLP